MRANYFSVLLVLLAVVIPVRMQASESGKEVILYTPYTKITVPPGESVNYNIELINNGDEVRNADIVVKNIPYGWKYEVKAGNWLVSQLSVLPKEKKSLSLKLDIPLKVNKGTYRFKVVAEGLGELPLAVTVSKQGTYRTEFETSQPNMQGNARSSFTFTASLKNQTAEQQLYALLANAPRGWNVVFKVNYKQATSAQVEPNATQNITIDVNPPMGIKAGTYKIPVRAATNTTSAELVLEVVITGTYALELTTPRGLLSSELTAGDTKRIELEIRNTGSAELKDIELSANKPVDWEVSFEPQKIERLAAGGTTVAYAMIKASKKALPGDYLTKISAKTVEANASADFRVAVRTPMVWGWIGVLIILVALGCVFFLFRKYGRR